MPPPPPARWLSPAPPAAAPPPDAEWPTLGSSPAPRAQKPAAAPLEIPAEELDLAQMLVEAGVPLIEIAEQLPSVAGRANAARELAKVLERVRRDADTPPAAPDAGAALSAPLAQLKLQLIEQLNAAPLITPEPSPPSKPPLPPGPPPAAVTYEAQMRRHRQEAITREAHLSLAVDRRVPRRSRATAALESEAWEVVAELQPEEDDAAMRAEIVARLQLHVDSVVPGGILRLFGSSSCGLNAKGADIDLTIEHPAGPNVAHDTSKAVVMELGGILGCRGAWANVEAITASRVPIVQLEDRASGLKIDISVGNQLARLKTLLLGSYAQLDCPRARALLRGEAVGARAQDQRAKGEDAKLVHVGADGRRVPPAVGAAAAPLRPGARRRRVERRVVLRH